MRTLLKVSIAIESQKLQLRGVFKLEKYCPLLASAQSIYYSTNETSEDKDRSKSTIWITRADGCVVGSYYDWRSGTLVNSGIVS